MKQRMLSVVVPVFNEEETLAYSVKELSNALASLQTSGWSSVEIIFVDDGSRDGSARILHKIVDDTTASSFISINSLHLSRNFGHSAAVFAGLAAARGDVVAVIDADLQDPPALIPRMLEELDRGGHDVVFGQRRQRQDETAFKRFSAWAFYRLLDRLAGIEIPKDSGDFRVMNREVVDAVLSCNESDPFLRGLVAWVGFDQKAFLYDREGRKFGETKYPFSKMLRFALTAIVSFSDVPLRMAFLVGMAGLGFFAILVIWALWVNYQGHTVPGWTSLLIGFTLGQSITLIIVGIVSYYVGQTFRQVQGRPRYILKSKKKAGA